MQGEGLDLDVASSLVEMPPASYASMLMEAGKFTHKN